MATNIHTVSRTFGVKSSYDVVYDNQGNQRRGVQFQSAIVQDTDDYNLFDGDEQLTGSVSIDLTACNIGMRGASSDWTGATKVLIEILMYEGTGTISLVGTGSNGLDAILPSIAVSPTNPYGIVSGYTLGAAVDSTHKVLTVTTSGTVKARLVILGKV